MEMSKWKSLWCYTQIGICQIWMVLELVKKVRTEGTHQKTIIMITTEKQRLLHEVLMK